MSISFLNLTLFLYLKEEIFNICFHNPLLSVEMGSSLLSKTGRKTGTFHKYNIEVTSLKFHNTFVIPPGYWLIFKGEKK